MYIYMYALSIYKYMNIHIYIYREREKEREMSLFVLYSVFPCGGEGIHVEVNEYMCIHV